MPAGRPVVHTARDVGRYFKRAHRSALKETPVRVRSSPETAVWHVLTQSNECIAKIFQADQSAAVRTEVDLVTYLRDANIRAPHLLPDRSGDVVGSIADGWLPQWWSRGCPVIVTQLERMRQVGPATVTREEMTLVAGAVAAMHAALRSYPQRDRIRPIQRLWPQMGCFEELLHSPNAASFDADELARWRALDERMEQVAAASRRPDLTESALHGDLGLEHVGFVGDDAWTDPGVYFFDFSDFARGPVIFDLVIMASRLYWESDIDLSRWNALVAWLRDGYAAASALSENDWAAFDGTLIERLLIEVRYLNRVALNVGVQYRPEGIRKRYELARHVLASGSSCSSTMSGSSASM